MTFKLKYRIAGLAILAALLPVVAMSLLSLFAEKKVSDIIKEKIDGLIEDSVRHVGNDIYGMCEATNAIEMERIDGNLNVARKIVANAGGFSFSNTATVKWQAVDQLTQRVREVELPQMLCGGVWLGQNADFRKPSLVVDEIVGLVGGGCTIFQRMDEQGDLLRVSTTTERQDGSRTIGTYIPALNPDGKPNPVANAILAGKSYSGCSFVVNTWYLAIYEPIKDKTGAVIGSISVGLKLNGMKAVSDIIKVTKVGKTGYIAVLGGQGDQRGRYIVSKNGERDGELIIDSKDARGDLFIKSMVDAAVKLKPDESAIQRYHWINPGETAPRVKMAALKYFEPWDWVIVSSTYADDYREINDSVANSMIYLLLAIVLGGICILIFVSILSFILGGRIGSPVEKISAMARLIAAGDLRTASDNFGFLSKAVSANGDIKESALSHDETGALISSIVSMTKNLNSLVGQVQRSIIQLASSATEIAASAKEQEAVINEFGASTTEIVASSKEISATSLHLVTSMKDVAEVSSRTSGLASAGHSSLGEMETMMGQLANATDSISSKLSVINDKANNINNVVTTITKVADQTNLLSLNAAIEAEKAGEFGKGFSVVAREVRRLADQTAVATLDITRMVKEMQSAVSSGVMEMDKFSEEVRHGVKETGQLSSQLAKIIEDVQSLPPVFNNVIEGMKQQSSGAQQISEAIVQLSEAVRQTSESLREFNQAVAQLNSATQGLQKEVSIFKVK